jgi:hypothetical protein
MARAAPGHPLRFDVRIRTGIGKIVLFLVSTAAVIAGLVAISTPDHTFPPVDKSVTYEYRIKDGRVYLWVEAHKRFIYVTQFGLQWKEVPEIARYHAAYFKFLERRELTDEIRREFFEWDKVYRSKEENRVNLESPDFSAIVPRGEDPYKWRPTGEFVSFRDFYEHCAKSQDGNPWFFDPNVLRTQNPNK